MRKRVTKRRKSKQIKKRRNTNKKRFFGGLLDVNSILKSNSKLYDDIPADKRNLDNQEMNRRNARFLKAMTNYTPAVERLQQIEPLPEKN